MNGNANGDGDRDGSLNPILWERKRWANEEYTAYESIGVEYEDSSPQVRKPIFAYSTTYLYLHPRTSRRPTSPLSHSPPLSVSVSVSLPSSASPSVSLSSSLSSTCSTLFLPVRFTGTFPDTPPVFSADIWPARESRAVSVSRVLYWYQKGGRFGVGVEGVYVPSSGSEISSSSAISAALALSSISSTTSSLLSKPM